MFFIGEKGEIVFKTVFIREQLLVFVSVTGTLTGLFIVSSIGPSNMLYALKIFS